MNHSSYKETNESIINMKENNKLRQEYIHKYSKIHNLILLKCDYFGMNSYYYNYTTKTMYKVCNVYNKYIDRGIEPNFEISTDYHILSLNNLIF